MAGPWLVLLPDTARAPCSLSGSVDHQRRVVRVWEGPDAGPVGRLLSGGRVELSAAPSGSPLHVLEFDAPLLSVLRDTHCPHCLRDLLGDRLVPAVCGDACECGQRAPSPTSGSCLGLLAHSYLCRVLHRRYWELSRAAAGGRAVAAIAFDLLVGVAVILLLKAHLTPGTVERTAGAAAEGIARAVDVLQRLIVWMMGAPIGLKVNKNLSWALGQFYLYHVSLWSNYIYSMVVPYLPAILTHCGFIGTAGISVFLSLVLDVLNIFVVHLSCFYIYACKLYQLQTRLLYSLWFLFLGKKWNPLRQRVDTAPFQVDRLFVGVLFFSMTVFLLPTTALFYVVFTAVRLVILILQGLICRPVIFVLSLPVMELTAWICDAASVRDRIRLHYLRTCNEQVFFRMQFVKKDFLEFYREKRYDVDSLFGETYSLSISVKRIISGHILYP